MNTKWNLRVKQYAVGKCYTMSNGDPAYEEIAKQAFLCATNVFVQFDKEKYLAKMREHEVPEHIIQEYLTNRSLDDDTWAVEADPETLQRPAGL